MPARRSSSVIACSIDFGSSAVVRLKTSGSSGYILSACQIFPFGLDKLSAGKEKLSVTKLVNTLGTWPEDELALAIDAEQWLPLPVSFPAETTPEEYLTYCNIEASYFLDHPEQYRYECAEYSMSNTRHHNKLLLFSPAEPSRKVAELLSAHCRIAFTGTPQLPLLYLSHFMEIPQVILELEKQYVLLTIASNGVMEKFCCHTVKSREEREYFTMKVLTDNQLCLSNGIQVTGSEADKRLVALISTETSVALKPLNLPPSLSVGNLSQRATSQPTVVKAIATAVMALGAVC